MDGKKFLIVKIAKKLQPQFLMRKLFWGKFVGGFKVGEKGHQLFAFFVHKMRRRKSHHCLFARLHFWKTKIK